MSLSKCINDHYLKVFDVLLYLIVHYVSLSKCIHDHYLRVFDVLLYFKSPLCLSLSVFMITI